MATTTVNAFNEMMDQFLTELNLTFPENKRVVKFQAAFEIMKQTSPKKIVDNFMNSVKPYGQKIMAKDESFILEDSKNIDGISDIDLPSIWTESSDTTKGAIWQYLLHLFILGTTITSFPTETLSMIEKVAEQCASQMKDSSLMDLFSAKVNNGGDI